MRKRVLFMVLCILLMLTSFTACGGKSSTDVDSESSAEVPESSISDDGDKAESEALPYFDEKTRILTAGIPNRFGTIEVYVPEVCTYIDADSFCASIETGSIILGSELGSHAKFKISILIRTPENVEDILDIRSENGHFVSYGENEYYTNEGEEGGIYYFIKINDYTYEFSTGVLPEYKADLEKILSTAKFNAPS
jgi:hypothetical protein